MKSRVTQVETGHAGNTVTASAEGNMEHGLLYVSNNIFIVVFSRAIISCCSVARAQHLGQNSRFVQHAIFGAQRFSRYFQIYHMTYQIYHTMYQDIFHDAISYSTRSHDILGMVGYGT